MRRARDGVAASHVSAADDAVSVLRIKADELEGSVRVARGSLETLRAAAADLDIVRATAESDLAHLAAACVAAVQASLDEVMLEVAALEAGGHLTPDAGVFAADEAEEPADEPTERDARNFQRCSMWT